MKLITKAMSWGAAVAVFFAAKWVVSFLVNEGGVVASRYTAWSENDRAGFVQRCRETGKETTVKEIGAEAMAQEGYPAMVEAYVGTYCRCMMGKVEASGAMAMKFNTLTTSRAQASARATAEVGAYMASPEGKEGIAECVAIATEEGRAVLAATQGGARGPSGK